MKEAHDRNDGNICEILFFKSRHPVIPYHTLLWGVFFLVVCLSYFGVCGLRVQFLGVGHQLHQLAWQKSSWQKFWNRPYLRDYFLEESKNFPTYPWSIPQNPPTNSLWRNSFHLGLLGCLGYAPGVCWGSLRKKRDIGGTVGPWNVHEWFISRFDDVRGRDTFWHSSSHAGKLRFSLLSGHQGQTIWSHIACIWFFVCCSVFFCKTALIFGMWVL